MTDLQSMGDLWTSKFESKNEKLEEKVEEKTTESENKTQTENVDQEQAKETVESTQSDEWEGKSVEDLFKEKQLEEQRALEKKMKEDYEAELQKEFNAKFGKSELEESDQPESVETDEADEKVENLEQSLEDSGASDEKVEEIKKKTKEVVEAQNKIVQKLQDENVSLITNNKELIIKNERNEIENEALRKQNSELIKELTTVKSSHISTEDVSIRHYAMLSQNLKENPEDNVSRQAKKEHLIKELQILDPRYRITLEEQKDLDVAANQSSDYIRKAKRISEENESVDIKSIVAKSANKYKR